MYEHWRDNMETFYIISLIIYFGYVLLNVLIIIGELSKI